MKQIPWSAADEKWTVRIITFDWLVFWGCFLAAVIVAALKHVDLGFLLLLLVLLSGIDLLWQQTKLQAMLVNKPRSMAELTDWVQLRPWQTEICCACGDQVHIDEAHWHPNIVDPGGGRFAIVCPCGIGYFKLKT